MRRIVIVFGMVGLLASHADAQRKPSRRTPVRKPAAAAPKTSDETDTLKSRTVTVTSSFKPSLRELPKINFSGLTPVPDSTAPRLKYNVPSQNLFFAYQPGTITPLAIAIDSSVAWPNSNFIKLGFGNFSTPYAQAGVSLGDGEHTIVRVGADYISSKGNLPFQEYNKINAEAIGIFRSSPNVDWDGSLFFHDNNQYRYGYQFNPSAGTTYTKDNLQQHFSQFGASVGVRDKNVNEYGISYHPTFYLSGFTDHRDITETNAVIDAPVSKYVGKVFAFNLRVNGNFSFLNVSGFNNSLVLVEPALQIKTPNIKLIAGITPSWDNNIFALLPNFSAEAKINNEKFIVQAGWVGYYNKNTYASLATFNPWISGPGTSLSTRFRELYAGFKGSAGEHVTYNARVSYLNVANQPLFVNGPGDGSFFTVLNEPSLTDIRIHGEIGYTLQEKLSFLAGASINQYSNLSVNDKAYGLLPLELNATMKWQILNDLSFRSDFFFFDGPQYRDAAGGGRKLDPGVDLNAGVEFTVIRHLNLWLQLNNIFNNRYQRWNQYPVLGFNVLGGIVYSFGAKAR